MKTTSLKRALAILALGAVAACSGGGGSGAPIPPAITPLPTPASGTAFVGIGDSLTAGYQSDGFLGATTATSTLSSYPGNVVPPGQENGFWAQMYLAVTENSLADPAALYNASTSPLPLIAAPGLGTQLVLNTTSLFANVQSGCSPFNDSAYSSSAWTDTRMSASDLNTDLGVPGITMHEAIAMTGPLTGPGSGATCGYKTVASDPTAGGLQSLVSGESGVFYPVMGSYMHHVSTLSELNVAVSLKPKLTTVWLGANDVLKFAFSGGNPVASDSPAQMGQDLTTIVKSLTGVGSKVLVADLPNVLSSPQFFPQGNRLIADLTTMLAGLSKGQISAGTATSLATAINTYVGTQYGVTSGGYLTESGFLAIVTNCLTTITACTTPQLDPTTTGSGLGTYYITPALATQVASLNAAYNQAIDAVATSSGSNVALVPINQTFAALAPSTTVPGSAPQLSTISPGAPTASFTFGGSLTTWDGLHPSNLGYAVIANIFLETANTAFGTTYPTFSAAQLGAVASTDPYNGGAVNAALGGALFPLP